ncbi:hypothetical protein [Candidatus Avelusimicrobium gallicola]|uniref:Uncharacterized protein n=1 Tax=Candidatus Avelusimicrobium gallicola TaxID=2562704 RepID=A0A1Y4DBY8_9BACT|nr:hypothetical protein [Elusimicrobium sp. An273]OUO56643.1 hypothetical protein B5F75_05485 [Elusimicrobium sp. An273]
MEFEIGQIVDKENYTQAAIWCNKNGAHIEKQGEDYVIMANPEPAVPTAEEQVRTKEAQTGLTRAVRELVLAEGSGASEYVKAKAKEIEALAAPLREADQ